MTSIFHYVPLFANATVSGLVSQLRTSGQQTYSSGWKNPNA